jgi:hypothetical protein
MSGRIYCCALLLLGTLVGSAARPAAAQIISAAPQSMPFPVLVGAEFTVDPTVEQSFALFNVAHGALQLRANEAGWVDMEAYCQVPDRHWGPLSMVSCTLQVSGGSSLTGLALPAHVSLSSLPMGTTVTLRLLMQAPLIIVDLEGQPSAVLDTFVEEYHWTLKGSTSTQPPVAATP